MGQSTISSLLVTGADFCPGYAIYRAILADAVALIREDRLFTADFIPTT